MTKMKFCLKKTDAIQIKGMTILGYDRWYIGERESEC